MKSVFESYPQLYTLRDLVPIEVIEREVGSRAAEFEEWRKKAREKIKTVKLCDVFPVELERGRIVLEDFLGHWGNVTVEEVCKIALIVKYFQPRRVFEFGTYNGMTTLQMALNAPEDAQIFTLDLTPDMANNTKFKLSELDRYVAAEFRDKFGSKVGSYYKGKPAERKITQILGDSAAFDYSPFHGNVDLVFIDAAHDYQNKKNDSENALRMLTPNGIVLWDNYDDVTNPDVTLYLGELAEVLPLYQLRGTPLVVYQRK